LTGRHDRKGFDCGREALNAWLRGTALQHQGKGISRTFVAVPHDEEAVQTFGREGYEGIGSSTTLGFYALAAALVLVESLPAEIAGRYPRQIPVTRLGRLAIRADMQGQGLGRLLLADAVERARGAAQAVCSAGIFVDAEDSAAARFYEHFGFRLCAGSPLKLYRPIW